MSWVTNVMLSVAPADVGSLAEITGPDSRWGGFTFPECHVHAAPGTVLRRLLLRTGFEPVPGAPDDAALVRAP